MPLLFNTMTADGKLLSPFEFQQQIGSTIVGNAAHLIAHHGSTMSRMYTSIRQNKLEVGETEKTLE